MTAQTYNQRYAAGDSNTAGDFLFDRVASQDIGCSKIIIGAMNANDGPVSSPANPLPVTGTLTAVTTVTTVATVTNISQLGGAAIAMGSGVRTAGTQRVTIATDDVVPVTDNGGSLTIDNAALSVTGGSVESSALRVTLASDSTGLLSVDDNGGSLTIDNAALSVTGGGAEAAALRVTLANDSTGARLRGRQRRLADRRWHGGRDSVGHLERHERQRHHQPAHGSGDRRQAARRTPRDVSDAEAP